MIITKDLHLSGSQKVQQSIHFLSTSTLPSLGHPHLLYHYLVLYCCCQGYGQTVVHHPEHSLNVTRYVLTEPVHLQDPKLPRSCVLSPNEEKNSLRQSSLEGGHSPSGPKLQTIRTVSSPPQPASLTRPENLTELNFHTPTSCTLLLFCIQM